VRLRFIAFWGVAVLVLAAGRAEAELQLGSPRQVLIPGITVDRDDRDGVIRGAGFDPRTGHLWLTGDFLQTDPADPEEVTRVDVVEYDPVGNKTLTALNVHATGAFRNGLPLSLAVHPTTGNLFIGWFDQVDSQPDHGGFAEITPAGAVASNGDLGNDFYAPGAAFNPAGKLVLLEGGALVLQVDPASRVIESTRIVHDVFHGQNYLSADFDPITGHLFLTGTVTGINEFDPETLNVLSAVDDVQFLPPPGPLEGVHGRVQSLAFSPAGDQLYLGGDFGLIVLDRAVPEPSMMGIGGMMGAWALRRRRSSR
jgi:hypothetical protein